MVNVFKLKFKKACFLVFVFHILFNFKSEALEATLAKCIKSGLKHNLKLKEAKLAVKTAYLDFRNLTLRYRLNFSLRTEFSDTTDSGDTSSFTNILGLTRTFKNGATAGLSFKLEREGTDTDNKISFSYEIPFLKSGGVFKETVDIKKAYINYLIARLKWINARRNTVLAITEAYYDLIKKLKNIDVSKIAVKQAKQLYEIAKAKYSAGLISKLDTLRAFVRLGEVEKVLLRTNFSYQQSLDRLLYLLNLPFSEKVDIKEPLALKLFTLNKKKVFKLAYEHREDLKILKYKIEKQKLEIKLKKRALKAELNMSVNLSHRNSNDVGTGQIASLLQFPLNYKVEKLKLNVENLKLKILFIELEDLKKRITLEIREAVRKFEEAIKRIKIMNKLVENAQANYEFARMMYDQGAATGFDVIDAQDKLERNKRDYIATLIDYKLAIVNLMREIGLIEVLYEESY